MTDDRGRMTEGMGHRAEGVECGLRPVGDIGAYAPEGSRNYCLDLLPIVVKIATNSSASTSNSSNSFPFEIPDSFNNSNQ